jgi:hypothetical protein
MFAYEREADDALVVAAGLPESWLAARGGVAVTGLPTWYGALDLTMRRLPAGTLHVTLGGTLACPRGGIVLRPPGPRPIRSVRVNGRPLRGFGKDEVVIREVPAEVVVAG